MSNTAGIEVKVAKLPTSSDRLAALYEESRERLRLAEGLLVCLKEARTDCEAQLERLQKDDPVKSVTGRSSLDEKISATTHMVDSLRRMVDELARRLSSAGALVPA